MAAWGKKALCKKVFCSSIRKRRTSHLKVVMQHSFRIKNSGNVYGSNCPGKYDFLSLGRADGVLLLL